MSTWSRGDRNVSFLFLHMETTLILSGWDHKLVPSIYDLHTCEGFEANTKIIRGTCTTIATLMEKRERGAVCLVSLFTTDHWLFF